MSIGLETQQARPSYARFERVAVEDVPASRAAGHYVARDEDYALVTPPGSKDVFKIKVKNWFVNLDQDAANGRIPPEWVAAYRAAYQAWQAGQDIPLDGTPIRGWGMLSPAQQETLCRLSILTVEDLAHLNGEARQRIGMGAVDLQNKAQAWLAQVQDKGPLTAEVAALKAENAQLKAALDALSEKLESLANGAPDAAPDDPLDDDLASAYKEKFGRKPHPNINPDKLRRLVA